MGLFGQPLSTFAILVHSESNPSMKVRSTSIWRDTQSWHLRDFECPGMSFFDRFWKVVIFGRFWRFWHFFAMEGLLLPLSVR